MIIAQDVRFTKDDLLTSTAGWKPRLADPLVARLSIALLAAWAFVVVAIIALLAFYAHPLWLALLLAPGYLVVFVLNSVLKGSKSLAGADFSKHALSTGPATFELNPQGITLRTAILEKTFKKGHILHVLESEHAFSILTKRWEMIIPKRAIENIPAVREALSQQLLLPIEQLPKGQIRTIAR